MVYVIIYLQKDKKDLAGFSSTETRTFRSAKAMLTYCFDVKKANYVTVEVAADSSFDYYVRLKDRD